MQTGKTRRDRDLLHDVYAIGKNLPAHSSILVNDTIWGNWSLQLYLYRHFNISLDKNPQRSHPYRLISSPSAPPDSMNFSEQKLDLKMFRLYELKH